MQNRSQRRAPEALKAPWVLGPLGSLKSLKSLKTLKSLKSFSSQLLWQPQPAASGLGEAVRQCAPLVARKGDWAALYMLLRERGSDMGYTQFCRLVSEFAPDAPQPSKNDIAASEWDTHRRRFPDWQPTGIRYDKFRRHYMIASRANDCLT